MGKRQFGVSTHLYHAQRLGRDHLLEIAAHGFEAVEVFAEETHFAAGNAASVADLQQWLAEAGLELTSVHAPVGDAAPGAIEAIDQALYIARRIQVKVFVIRLEGSRDAARRMVDHLTAIAPPLGVRIAVETGSDERWPPGSLLHFIEEDLDSCAAGGCPGICLDFGRAHIAGDLAETIELVSEHLVAVHLHDNRGRRDDHLVPFEGTIDWPAALTTLQKVGFDGTMMFDVDARGSSSDTLRRLGHARERFEKLLCTSI